MAKASKALNPAHREVVQNSLVDLVRRSIMSGVAYSSLGTELMAQGYAILTGKDVAAARIDVVAMMDRGSKAVGAAPKRKVAAKRGAKAVGVKKSAAKNRTASKRGGKRKGRGRR
jgi:hypothetical protein